jgi:trk system potassium uptake protein TrkH
MANFSEQVHWVAVVLMIMGALPFPLYVSIIRGKAINIFKDEQVETFLLSILAASVMLALWLYVDLNYDIFDAFHVAVFNVVSVITTTGFAIDDYSAWGGFSFVIFFYLMFIGGCSGSTSGSLKVFRFQIAWVLLKSSLKKMVHPSAVLKTQYNGYPLDYEITNSILTFSFFFAIVIAVIAICLSFTGLDPTTSLTGAIATVTNIGPGLGENIGPVQNYATLSDGAKWILSTGMLFGRLEIITVLVILTPWFWRK